MEVSFKKYPMYQNALNFKNHKLLKVNEKILQYKITGNTEYLPIGLIVFGIVFGLLSVILAKYTESTLLTSLFYIIISIILIMAGLIAKNLLTIKISFDKTVGYFYIGDEKVVEDFNYRNSYYAHLKNIYGLQILKLKMGKSSTLYEFNVILNSGDRIHIIKKANYKELLNELKILSNFLSVKIYDFSEDNYANN